MATTIQIDQKTKEKLASFGKKGETYQDIINRLYDIAVQQQLHDLLYSGHAVSIDSAIARAKQRWQK
jgi:hypothetical protein